jgi:hypothetical protein
MIQVTQCPWAKCDGTDIKMVEEISTCAGYFYVDENSKDAVAVCTTCGRPFGIKYRFRSLNSKELDNFFENKGEKVHEDGE